MPESVKAENISGNKVMMSNCITNESKMTVHKT